MKQTADIAGICAELGIPRSAIDGHGLCPHEEAKCLELAELSEDGREHLLVGSAAVAWKNLKAAAQGDGVSLFIVSAFRSVERQAEIIRRKIAAGAVIEEILTVNVPPGYSEHHTGRAVDIGVPGDRILEVEFDQTPAFAWLTAYACDFNFYMSYPESNRWGIQYEPWHWCFDDIRPII